MRAPSSGSKVPVVAARVQVPIGNGLVLMQSPSGDDPGVVLLLSVGKK